jgi:hypothetical protein
MIRLEDSHEAKEQDTVERTFCTCRAVLAPLVSSRFFLDLALRDCLPIV